MQSRTHSPTQCARQCCSRPRTNLFRLFGHPVGIGVALALRALHLVYALRQPHARLQARLALLRALYVRMATSWMQASSVWLPSSVSACNDTRHDNGTTMAWQRQQHAVVREAAKLRSPPARLAARSSPLGTLLARHGQAPHAARGIAPPLKAPRTQRTRRARPRAPCDPRGGCTYLRSAGADTALRTGLPICRGRGRRRRWL